MPLSQLILQADSPTPKQQASVRRMPSVNVNGGNRNKFYDTRWKEKEERAFQSWCNFILTPDDFKLEQSGWLTSETSLVLKFGLRF